MRVYQQFATLDLLSGGRAEIMAGRGSFIESFPLFGYDLNDYDELFAEKLELLVKSATTSASPGQGEHRAPLQDQAVYPRTPNKIPIWVAVGGNPPSAIRAGTLGLPMALAIIGGMPERFRAVRRSVPRGGASTPATTRRHCRSASTPTAMSPTPRSRPPTSSSRAMPRR